MAKRAQNDKMAARTARKDGTQMDAVKEGSETYGKKIWRQRTNRRKTDTEEEEARERLNESICESLRNRTGFPATGDEHTTIM